MLVLKRLVLVTLALLIFGGGTILIGFCVIPETKKILVDQHRRLRPAARGNGHQLGWPDPTQDTCQDGGLVVASRDAAPDDLPYLRTEARQLARRPPGPQPRQTRRSRAPEKAAGATFMQLILTDFVVGVLSFFLPKFFNLNCIPKTTYFIKSTLGLEKKKAGKAGKKSNKTDPKPPPSPSPFVSLRTEAPRRPARLPR